MGARRSRKRRHGLESHYRQGGSGVVNDATNEQVGRREQDACNEEQAAILSGLFGTSVPRISPGRVAIWFYR